MFAQVTLNFITDWLLNYGIHIIFIIILAITAIRIIGSILEKYFNNFIKNNGNEEVIKRNNTLKSIIKSVFDIIIVITASLLILNKLGLDIRPILAAAGVVGIAVGFGAKRFVEDIINGIIILLENQIRVGDVVEVADKCGFVEKVDLKMVVLRDLSGNVHYIRNGKIDIVTNMTKDFSYSIFDIGVAYKENVDNVINVIKEVYDDLATNEYYSENILEPIEILGLDRFEDSAVIIKARIKTKPIKQWEIGRAFNKMLKNKFDELNIEIPFPHRTLFLRKDETTELLSKIN